MVLARPADSEGLIELVLRRACHLGSIGAIGAAALAVTAAPAVEPAGAAAGVAAGWLAQGASPGTSTVSNLMTSTGQPSAATMIDGVSGLMKSAFIAGGRIRQVVSVTSKTSGQSFSQASQ